MMIAIEERRHWTGLYVGVRVLGEGLIERIAPMIDLTTVVEKEEQEACVHK